MLDLYGMRVYARDEGGERQVSIHERRDWCYPFKEKIKRMCRVGTRITRVG